MDVPEFQHQHLPENTGEEAEFIMVYFKDRQTFRK